MIGAMWTIGSSVVARKAVAIQKLWLARSSMSNIGNLDKCDIKEVID